MRVPDATPASTMWVLDHFEDADNEWQLYLAGGGAMIFVLDSTAGGASAISFNTGAGAFSDNTWHHVAVIKVADTYGIYVDGVHKGSDTTAETANLTGTLYIGQNSTGGTTYWDGWLDSLRVTKSNIFSADPTDGGDTITVPISEPTIDDGDTAFSLEAFIYVPVYPSVTCGSI